MDSVAMSQIQRLAGKGAWIHLLAIVLGQVLLLFNHFRGAMGGVHMVKAGSDAKGLFIGFANRS